MIHARKDYQTIQDASGKIPFNEPVFLIRAQDVLGAKTVRAWADFNDANDGDQELSRLARDHADLMDAWGIKKKADL